MNRYAWILLCLFLVAGCATEPPPPPLTVEVANQQIAQPPKDKAQIVFMQPFKPIGGGSHAIAIFEIKDSKKEMQALLSSRSKAIVLVEPGKHLFMSTGFGASFLKADVEAGKRYYVLSRFIAYVGYQLRPIRKTTVSDYNTTIPEFQEWLRACSIVTPTAEGLNWVSANRAMFDKVQTDAWGSWQRKNPEEHAQLTLNSDDDVAH